MAYADVPKKVRDYIKVKAGLNQGEWEWLLTLLVCVYTLFVAYTSGFKLRGTEAMMTRASLTVGACILYSVFK